MRQDEGPGHPEPTDFLACNGLQLAENQPRCAPRLGGWAPPFIFFGWQPPSRERD